VFFRGQFGISSRPHACHISSVRKHHKLLIALACLLVIGGVVVFATRDSEPHYQGRSISEWLVYSSKTVGQYKETEVAVRAMGTNVIPCLLKWTRARPSALQETARSKLPRSVVQSSFGKFLTGSSDKMPGYAVAGFKILGTNATAAIPELQSMIQDTAHPETGLYSIEALANIGSPAFPVLAAAFSDKGHLMRYGILFEVAYATPERFSPHEITSLLQTAFEDPKLQIRKLATNAALKIAPELLTNTPAK